MEISSDHLPFSTQSLLSVMMYIDLEQNTSYEQTGFLFLQTNLRIVTVPEPVCVHVPGHVFFSAHLLWSALPRSDMQQVMAIMFVANRSAVADGYKKWSLVEQKKI